MYNSTFQHSINKLDLPVLLSLSLFLSLSLSLSLFSPLFCPHYMLPCNMENFHEPIDTLTIGNSEVSQCVTRRILAGCCTAQPHFRGANASHVHMHR